MRRAQLRWATAAMLMCMAASSQASVLWERYRGQQYVPTPLIPPNYDHVTGAANDTTAIDRLLVLAGGGAANAADSGSSAQVNWSVADQQLCDTSRNASSDACVKRAMGQVMYTVLRFPQAGSYTLSLSHDDAGGLDLASDAGGPGYRDAPFQPVARLPRWTGQAAPETLTTYTTTQPNACVLARLTWNNWGTTNHYGLYWSGPGIVGTALVPASALLDPSVTQAANCIMPIDAANDSAALAPGAPSVLVPVLANDTAGNGGTLDAASVAVVTPPAAGSATCTAAGCTYTPPAGGLTASVTFTYRVCLAAPNQALCDVATVTIAPAAAGGVAAVPVGGREALAALSLLLGLAGIWQRRRRI